MSDKAPKFTKQDLDKLLNCSDKLQSTFNAFRAATKKLNDEREKVKKQSQGIPTSTRSSNYYNNIVNKKALNKANSVIDNLVKQFSVDVANIKKNIGVLGSQASYENRMKDLIEYYKKNINHDKLEIEREQSKKAIANRMSYYYNNNDNAVLGWQKYIMYVYWALLLLSTVMLAYNLMHMQSFLNSIKDIFTTIKNKVSKNVEKAKKKADKLENKIRKVQNPLNEKQQAQILRGPGRESRASSSLGPNPNFTFSGGSKSKYSTQPWLTIICLLLSVPVVFKIAKYIIPYLNRFAFPKLDY